MPTEDTTAAETTDTAETATNKRRKGYVPPGGVPVYDAELCHTGFFHFNDLIAVDADAEAVPGGLDAPVALLVVLSRDGCAPVTMRTYARSLSHFIAHVNVARKRWQEAEQDRATEKEEEKTRWAQGLINLFISTGKELGIFGGGGGAGFDGPYPGDCGVDPTQGPPSWPPIPRKVGPPVMVGDDLYFFAAMLQPSAGPEAWAGLRDLTRTLYAGATAAEAADIWGWLFADMAGWSHDAQDQLVVWLAGKAPFLRSFWDPDLDNFKSDFLPALIAWVEDGVIPTTEGPT